jgi:hypothetical protein
MESEAGRPKRSKKKVTAPFPVEGGRAVFAGGRARATDDAGEILGPLPQF